MTDYRCDTVQPGMFRATALGLRAERMDRVRSDRRRLQNAAPQPHGMALSWRPPFAPRTSDLDHLEVFLARAAFRAGPVNGNVLPARARRNAFLRQTGFFVVNPAANQAHPALIFHSCVAS